MIAKREEIMQAVAVGVGLAAQGLDRVSEATRHAAQVLEKVASSLEEQGEEQPDGSGTASPDPSGPTGPYDTPYSTGSSQPYPSPRAPHDGPWDDQPVNP